MKKFIISLLAIAMVIVSSCTPNDGFVYNANVVAEGDGNMLVTFPNGKLDVAGIANVDFNYSNDIDTTNAVDFYELLSSNTNGDVIRQLNQIEPLFDVQFKAFKPEGHAKISIHAYIKLLNPEIIAKFDKDWEWKSPQDTTSLN